MMTSSSMPLIFRRREIALVNVAPCCLFCGSWLDRADPKQHLSEAHFECHHSFKRAKAIFDRWLSCVLLVARHCYQRQRLLTANEAAEWDAVLLKGYVAADDSVVIKLIDEERGILSQIQTIIVEFNEVANYIIYKQPGSVRQFLERHVDLQEHCRVEWGRMRSRPEAYLWETLANYYRDQTRRLASLVVAAESFRRKALDELRVASESARVAIAIADTALFCCTPFSLCSVFQREMGASVRRLTVSKLGRRRSSRWRLGTCSRTERMTFRCSMFSTDETLAPPCHILFVSHSNCNMLSNRVHRLRWRSQQGSRPPQKGKEGRFGSSLRCQSNA